MQDSRQTQYLAALAARLAGAITKPISYTFGCHANTGASAAAAVNDFMYHKFCCCKLLQRGDCTFVACCKYNCPNAQAQENSSSHSRGSNQRPTIIWRLQLQTESAATNGKRESTLWQYKHNLSYTLSLSCTPKPAVLRGGE